VVLPIRSHHDWRFLLITISHFSYHNFSFSIYSFFWRSGWNVRVFTLALARSLEKFFITHARFLLSQFLIFSIAKSQICWRGFSRFVWRFVQRVHDSFLIRSMFTIRSRFVPDSFMIRSAFTVCS